ncbi:EamA family transporter [Rhizobium vallis]|nr:EamA family transporter [Rhizobium vallis]
MSGLSASTSTAIVFCVLTEAGREICFKHGSVNAVGMLLLRPAILLGILFWAVELVVWSWVLTKVPLSIAFPLMAMTYVVIALAGVVFFNEKINLRHACGIALVMAGIICIGTTGS